MLLILKMIFSLSLSLKVLIYTSLWYPNNQIILNLILSVFFFHQSIIRLIPCHWVFFTISPIHEISFAFPFVHIACVWYEYFFLLFLLFYCDVLRVHEKICRAYVRIKRAFLTEIDCAAVARARKKEQDEENIPPAREWQGGVTQLHYHAERICHVDVSKSWRVEIFHAPKWEMPHPGNFARFRNWLAHVSRLLWKWTF